MWAILMKDFEQDAGPFIIMAAGFVVVLAVISLIAVYPFVKAAAFAWKVQAIGEAGIDGEMLKEIAKIIAQGVM